MDPIHLLALSPHNGAVPDDDIPLVRRGVITRGDDVRGNRGGRRAAAGVRLWRQLVAVATGPRQGHIMSIERELDPDQQPDGELDGTEMVAYERAEELAEQFEAIETATVEDGVVRGAVTAIDTTRNNGRIAVSVDVPAETEPEQFVFKKPKAWGDSYAFVRWVESYDYSAGDFQGMIEKNVEVDVVHDGGDYELVVPGSDRTVRESLYERVDPTGGVWGRFPAFVFIGLFGVVIGPMLFLDGTEPGSVADDEEDYERILAMSLYSTLQWTLVVLAVVLL